MKYAEGYSYEELAEVFELSVSACKMRVSRARDKVQELHQEKDRRTP
jgi:DNA-directed RNA polymerase specialized sigma24 family protein